MRLHHKGAVRLLREGILALVGAVVFVLTFGGEGHAQSIKIVAIGASNTAGQGVGPSAAWPAQLEAMLKARGMNAEVINAGISGDTSCGMLARMDSAVASGTKVVIMQTPGFNDQRKGCGGTQGNIATMRARLQARNIRVVEMGFIPQLTQRYPQPDRIHITTEGHTKAAAMILPAVLAAARR
jgi:acyl-CoA thioesterase I